MSSLADDIQSLSYCEIVNSDITSPHLLSVQLH